MMKPLSSISSPVLVSLLLQLQRRSSPNRWLAAPAVYSFDVDVDVLEPLPYFAHPVDRAVALLPSRSPTSHPAVFVPAEHSALRRSAGTHSDLTRNIT